MPPSLELHEDRLFPADPTERAIARELYTCVRDQPLICPHGHVDAALLADNRPFPNPAELLIVPDHYVTRLLYSQGVPLEQLGLRDRIEEQAETDPRQIWHLLAEHWHLFRGTPTRLWLEQELHDVFGIHEALSAETADCIYDRLEERLASEEYLPRSLYDRFRIEVLTTTDSPLATLEHHERIAADAWSGRVIPAFRPDSLVDFEHERWGEEVARLAELSGEDTTTYRGYIAALEARRAVFAAHGATSADHGHPTANTVGLEEREAARLYERALRGEADGADAELFRAHMLMEFARMSCDDGLVMQLHPGSFRNHNRPVFERFGRDVGADIPTATDYAHGLRPLLNRFGNDRRLTLIVFTLDESTYSRELAPLAGHYPAMLLGPAWWFHDSPEGMRRFRELSIETAGFYNTVGFNDDTRAFPSIPSRHDVARRVDCSFLARLVAEHRLPIEEAAETAVDLAYRLPKRAYKL